MRESQDRSKVRTGTLLILFFFSGAAALIYEVLWLKELGLLFGGTANAAVTTLACFLSGLVAGRSSRLWLRNIPLAAFAGDLSAMRGEFEPFSISTDDRSHLEYLAPRTERGSRGSGTTSNLAFVPLGEFCDRILASSDPLTDPFLALVSDQGFREIEAGPEIYKYVGSRDVSLHQAGVLDGVV